MTQSQDAGEGGVIGPTSFELFETESGGMIRGSDGEGGTTEIYLSSTDVYVLARSAHQLRDRLLSQLAAGRGSVVPRVSVRVVAANLNVDLLVGAVQLSLTDPTGLETTYELSDEVAEFLAERLPAQLTQAKAKRPETKSSEFVRDMQNMNNMAWTRRRSTKPPASTMAWSAGDSFTEKSNRS